MKTNKPLDNDKEYALEDAAIKAEKELSITKRYSNLHVELQKSADAITDAVNHNLPYWAKVGQGPKPMKIKPLTPLLPVPPIPPVPSIPSIKYTFPNHPVYPVRPVYTSAGKHASKPASKPASRQWQIDQQSWKEGRLRLLRTAFVLLLLSLVLVFVAFLFIINDSL